MKKCCLKLPKKEEIWLRELANDFGLYHDQDTMYCNIFIAIYLAKNHVHHEMIKHIDM